MTLALGIGIVTLIGTGCDSLLGSGRPRFADRARVIIEGDTPVPLTVVTSTRFIAVRSEGGSYVSTLILADTVTLDSLPYDQVHGISGADRFLVRLINPDSTVTATIHMRVRLDDNEVFNQRATMRAASLESISFYGFH